MSYQPCNNCGIWDYYGFCDAPLCVVCLKLFPSPVMCSTSGCRAWIEYSTKICKSCDAKLCFKCHRFHVTSTKNYSYFSTICKLCRHRLCRKTYNEHKCKLCRNRYCGTCKTKDGICTPCWIYVACKQYASDFPKDMIINIIKCIL